MADDSKAPTTDLHEIEFTDREMQMILNSLPSGLAPATLDWVERDLRHLAKHRLPLYFSARELTTEERRQVSRVERAAADLWKALTGLSSHARRKIGLELARPEGMVSAWWWAQEEIVATARERMDAATDCALSLARGAEQLQKNKEVGRPFNFASMMSILALDQIYQRATGRPTTRVVARSPDDGEDYDTGPFHDFAAAVWPVLFGNGDYGLSAALKKLAKVWNENDDDPDDGEMEEIG